MHIPFQNILGRISHNGQRLSNSVPLACPSQDMHVSHTSLFQLKKAYARKTGIFLYQQTSGFVIIQTVNSYIEKTRNALSRFFLVLSSMLIHGMAGALFFHRFIIKKETEINTITPDGAIVTVTGVVPR